MGVQQLKVHVICHMVHCAAVSQSVAQSSVRVGEQHYVMHVPWCRQKDAPPVTDPRLSWVLWDIPVVLMHR
jgi:hypothetical protein